METLTQVFIILVTTSSVLPNNIQLRKNLDSGISELSLLFDVAKNDEKPLERKHNQICDTDACRIIANEFKRGMNTSIEPCDDFYEFVCGAWGDVNPIPNHKATWGRYEIFQDIVDRRIRDILGTPPEKTDILPVRQAKKWYQACMDIDTLNKRDIKPMESVLLQVGGWPMTLDPEEWNENEHSWQSVEHDYFHITGSHVFFQIEQSFRSEFDLRLSKGSLPLAEKLPPKYRNYTGNDYEAYAEFISEVTKMFVDYNKAAVTEEMIRNDVHDLVEFEKELYMLAKTDTDDDYFHDTVAEFVEWYRANITDLDSVNNITEIDFRSLIRRRLDLVNRQMNDSYRLTLESKSYFLQLTELLNQTPTRTIVNYLHWYFVSDMLIYTTESMRNAFFELMMNEYDVKERAPRWLECIEEMKMTTASGFAFVEKYYSPEVDKAARGMIEIVREEMKSQIDESTWMDEDSKTIAKEKIDAMKFIVGFPDWYKNKTAVLNAYKGLTIGYDHFDNVLSFRKYESKKALKYESFESLIESSMSDVDPIVVNAYYYARANHIALPAANFQPPLFTSRVPPSVDYGIVGHTVGHEIGHGFDDNGILMGKDGKKTKLSANMLDLYTERADCFLEQFNEYYGVTEQPNMTEPSRGRSTRPDNIADSAGLNAIFRAFKKFIKDHSTENYKLPGLDEFTDDQMLFISYAATWCEVVTPKYEEKMKQEDEHSPGRLRVIGPVSNSNDFARAFNCPIGSPMNPQTKCDIWK